MSDPTFRYQAIDNPGSVSGVEKWTSELPLNRAHLSKSVLGDCRYSRQCLRYASERDTKAYSDAAGETFKTLYFLMRGRHGVAEP